MKFSLIVLFSLLSVFTAQAQKFQSEESYIKFYSSAPLEDIEAVNRTGRSIIDLEKGEIVYSVKIKDFKFDKSLMQEHFNENYLESDKYPNSTLSGKILDWNGNDGKQKVRVTGKLDIHGISKDVQLVGTIDYSEDKVTIESVFWVELKDYKIKIPKAVFYNIAEKVEVTIKFEYKPI